MSKCIMCLHNLPVFEGLPMDEFRDICLSASKYSLDKGETLFTQGQYADTVYLIKEGSIKLVQFSENGREIVLNIIGRGHILGENALFKRQNYVCDAVAMEHVSICSFSLNQFEELIKTRPSLALSIISNLGQKLDSALKQIGDSAHHSVEDKLLALLFRLSSEYGKDTSQGQLIEISITQEEMANMIGSSRVMVAHTLKKFKQEGFLLKKGKYYIIDDKCLSIHFRKERINISDFYSSSL